MESSHVRPSRSHRPSVARSGDRGWRIRLSETVGYLHTRSAASQARAIRPEEASMERHGSESSFVIGEGLLGESVGGRERTLAAPEEALTPPFRFSRMGPSGINHQLGEAVRETLAGVMTSGGGGTSGIPAGLTYLGQFVDHDLTFDKTG